MSNVSSDEILTLAAKIEKKIDLIAKTEDVSKEISFRSSLSELQIILHALIVYYDRENAKEVALHALNKL